MNLIAYSDSEDSGDDAPSVPKIASKPAPKPAFQKVVDRSNPGKIKLNLPGVTRPQASKDELDAEGPPAKKARMGGGAFGGFNAMLPAPKKPQVDATTAAKRGGGKGLGLGVNLKTGAEPAFKRESRLSEMDEFDENGNPVKKEPMNKEDFRALLNLPAPKSGDSAEKKPYPVQKEGVTEHGSEVKPAEAPKPRFMPLSVARGKKKKPVVPRPTTVPTDAGPSAMSSSQAEIETKPPPKPKVSLFSMTQETQLPAQPQPTDDYQPLLYNAPTSNEPSESFHADPQTSLSNPVLPSAPSGGLTNIASELNLTPAEQRQLFGRKGAQGGSASFSTAKFVEFNTDAEYAHNEQLRAQGETVQHNALKSISGTGKNSLRSLVNVAVGQKDALEEHFAQGRRNKKEAGGKYGW